MTSTFPAIATTVLVVAIASTLASVTWKMIPSVPIVVPPTQIDVTKGTNSQVLNTNTVFNQIPNWHLFGTVQKNVPQEVVQAPIVPEIVPDTTLNLTLKGVVSSVDMMDAWAIIADRMGNEDSYGVESELPGGATLKEIYVDRIILLHNGRLETLRLPTTDMAGANVPSAASSRSSRQASNRNVSSRNTQSTRSSGNVTQVSSAGTAILKDYRNKLLNDPQSVMNSVRAEPYRQAGKLKGYRIFPGRDKGLFGQLGLEPGDVVTSVNGIELDSPLKGLEVMQNITDASEVSVDVLRNGVNQTFLVPMN